MIQTHIIFTNQLLLKYGFLPLFSKITDVATLKVCKQIISFKTNTQTVDIITGFSFENHYSPLHKLHSVKSN